MEKLCSKSKSEREQAATELLENTSPSVLRAVAQLLHADIPTETHSICLDILEKNDVSISLEDIRQDEWLKKVEEEADNFHLVARIVGKRNLAYSILLGLQITNIKTDSDHPAGTIVHFTSESDMVQVLPLSQFNLQVTNVLLSLGVNAKQDCCNPLTDTCALNIIGELPLLVAPLFDISLRRLIAMQLGDEFYAAVGITTPSGHSYLPIKDFHDLILRLIQSDLQKLGQEKLFLDLSTDAATEAFTQHNYEKVVALLETWPALLSTLLKSPAKEELTKEQLQQIAEGTKMLGDAYQHQDKDLWAKETYRLGIRYTSDTPHPGPLYLALGQLYNKEECYGEAIGYLRRAMTLQPNCSEPCAALGTALFHRKRFIGALVLFQHATSMGTLDETAQNNYYRLLEHIEEKEIGWLGWLKL